MTDKQSLEELVSEKERLRCFVRGSARPPRACSSGTVASQGSCVIYFLSHSVSQSNQSTSSLLPSVLKMRFPSECFVISQEYYGWQVTQNLSTHQFKQIGVYFYCITKSWRSLRAFCLSALPSLALWFVTSWPQESCCGSGDSDYIPGRMKGGKNESSLTH